MSDDFDIQRVTWVLDGLAVERLKSAIESTAEVSWDLETTGLNEFKQKIGEPKIVLASFTMVAPGSSEPDTWLLPLYHPESVWLGSWRLLYRSVARLMVGKYLMAHNGKFDCRWTWHHVGVDLSGSLMWDSRLSSHALDENRPTKLKSRAPATFDIPPWDDFDLTYENAALDVPLIDLGLYAARDTYWTWRLAMAHRVQMFTHAESHHPPIADDEVEDARLGRLMVWAGMPTSRTLTAIEQRGFLLDTEWVAKRIEEDEQVRLAAREFLTSRYPEPPHTCMSEECVEDCPAWKWPMPENASFAATSIWFKRWTAIAVERGDLSITAMTKNGNAQWNKAVLIRQERSGSEVARQLLVHRGAVKRLEYLRAWLGYVREDGAVHASYNVGSILTGRLSSSEPNMQQVTKALRPAFVARPGYVIADFDYSQIELRVAAFISRCIPMIEAFQRGDDLHTLLAGRITSKMSNLSAVTPEERQAGKSANFGLLYLMSAAGFRMYAETVYDVSFTRQEAEDIHRAFFEMWDGMRQWHSKSISRAHATGQAVSPIGRVRRVPGVFSDDDGRRAYAERAAVNAPVQGFASDLMQIAAALIEGTLPGSEPLVDCRLVATVHDSIVAELPADRWEEVAKEVINRMTNGVLDVLTQRFHCDFDVPLVAEATVGSRWGLSDIGKLA